jgi:hypothetical protein
MAVSNTMAIMGVVFLGSTSDTTVPEYADKAEMTNVITEIQRFIGVDIRIPLMLYATRAPMLSKLFDKAIRNVFRICSMSFPVHI